MVLAVLFISSGIMNRIEQKLSTFTEGFCNKVKMLYIYKTN